MRKLTVALVGVLLAGGIAPPTAMAWDKQKAAAYAETYAINENKSWPYFSNDCANFVSQCLKAGGVAMDTSRTNRADWWMAKNMNGAWIWGYPWTVAQSMYDYFRGDSRFASGRYFIKTYDWVAATSYPTPPNDNASVGVGDIISYDWNTAAKDGVDHVGIVTARGTDAYNSAYYGDLACYHTSDIKRVIWHARHRLSPSLQASTTYWVWGLSTTVK